MTIKNICVYKLIIYGLQQRGHWWLDMKLRCN